MRKVESLVVSFLRQNITSRASSNMAVEYKPTNPAVLQVKLHGNAIADYRPFNGAGWGLELRECGWRTRTTASRLKALLAALAPGYRIIQRDHAWYLETPRGERLAWKGGATVTPNGVTAA